MAQFRHILSASDGLLNGGCSFEIMVEHKAFVSVPNSLDQHAENAKRSVASTFPAQRRSSAHANPNLPFVKSILSISL